MAENGFSGNVAHKRKDNRIEETVIIISIEDEAYQTLDWSFGGFRIGGYGGDIQGNTEFMINGLGPDLGTVFAIRVDCKAIRVANGQLSASFIELESEIYDILEALMGRREKPLEKLKTRLSYRSMAASYQDPVAMDISKINEAFKILEASIGDRKKELLGVHQEAIHIKDQGLNLGYDLMMEICNVLCLFIEKLDKAGPKEIGAIKLHIDSMKLVVANDIKGTGGDAGEKMLAGLQQVCDKLRV